MKAITSKHAYILPLCLLAMIMLFFWVFYPVYPQVDWGESKIILWMVAAWRGDFVHGWAVPVLFVVFIIMSWEKMRQEQVGYSWLGFFTVLFSVALFVVSVRTIQPRVALFGLPFLIFGSIWFVSGWKIARHMLFPSFFWWFAISVPGLQQATNGLQILVTKSCYYVGEFLGMELVVSGNNIHSATGNWNELKIAEGCSGIRSLMALVMIAVIYAYFTQKRVWKMAILFVSSLPLALIANFFRIFTILVLSELGFSDFASGVYHDWAGLLFFFPVALAGLFLIDKILNRNENRKIVRKRVQ